MKVLLAYLCEYSDRHDYYISLLPHGLTSLAAYLEKNGVDTELANYSSMGYRRAAKHIAERKPRVLGLSLFSYNRTETLKLVREVKRLLPRIVIVAGGMHAAFLAEEILKRYPEIDHIVAGEGELAFLRLVRDIQARKKPARTVSGERCADLDSLPFPPSFAGSMHGVNPNEQFKYLVTTRGCPHRCTFCCSPAFWGRSVSYRSPESILEEIRFLHKKFGIVYFGIRDDNFALKKDRVIKFSRLLASSGMYLMWNCQARADAVDEEMLVEMKRAGLEHIQYGVESGSARILERYDKAAGIDDILRAAEITRRVGVYLSIYLMAGMDGETKSDISATVSLIRRALPGDGVVSPVAYYPGTQLYEQMKARGLVRDEDWFRSRESGLYLRPAEAAAWIRQLMNELGLIRRKSWYRAEDFRDHRKVSGDSCWVTDILEGDYFLDEERHPAAEASYLRVVKRFSKNPWGWMRLGKLRFMTGEYDDSRESYRMVTELVPSYYGGWLKLAESQIASDRSAEAAVSAERAAALNPFDERIRHVRGLLKTRKR